MRNIILVLLVYFSSSSYALDIVSHLKHEEGFSSTVYLCPRGYPTIGYGHRCKANHKPITRKEAERLLMNDISIAMKAVDKMVSKSTPEQVRFILISMTFQMGEGGVRDFKNMLRNINNQNYKAASVNMQRSLWKKQTPERCLRLAKIMASVQ